MTGLEEQDLPDALASFIKQYYSRAGNAPRELALDRDIDDREGVEALLSSLRGAAVFGAGAAARRKAANGPAGRRQRPVWSLKRSRPANSVRARRW